MRAISRVTELSVSSSAEAFAASMISWPALISVLPLACEIAPEFGVEPSPQVQRIAMASKRNLKRINNPDDIMSLPYAIVATRQRFNVYAGNY